jgi:FtsP/CotA-like multicopper oxidase with cupredoxin domain
MQPWEIQLWRMVNASMRAVTKLVGFTPKNGIAPEIRLIAQDGVQFHYENYRDQPLLGLPPTGTPRPNTFAPGNRVDILVKAPLQTESFDFTVVDPTISMPSVMLTLKVEGERSCPPMEFPTDTDYPAFPAFLGDIKSEEIRIWRKLDFGRDPGRPAQGFLMGAPQFMINGKGFSGDGYDQTMVLGDAEEWTLTNSTSRIAHPFHIHRGFATLRPIWGIAQMTPNSDCVRAGRDQDVP